jgi:ribosomal protein L11 methyltransferase
VPSSWLRLSVRSPSPELAGLLAEGLVACGGGAVEEHGDRLVTYIPVDDDVGAAGDVSSAGDGGDLVRRVREQLAAVLDGESLELEAEHVAEQDWLALWRAGLSPRRVGDRIIVSPTWSDVDAGPDDIVIRIDPQMAFGTGEHASTRGVLRLLQRVLEPGTRLLDVGAGSAILAIAAARLGAAHVLAVESDPEAMENAAENVERNEATSQVTLQCALVDDAFLRDLGDASLDGILANVLSGVLRPLLPAFHGALRPGGWAILAGILREEADAMREAAAAAGFRVEAEDAEEQWWGVLLRRA